MNDNGCPCTQCCAEEVNKFDKVINYPNKFQSYNKLDPVIRSIVTDRGNKFRYRATVSSENTTNIACLLPSGIVVSGIGFFNPEDDITDLKTGLRIAAGRLEGSLKYFDELGRANARFSFNGTINRRYAELNDPMIASSLCQPAPAQRAPRYN